MYCLVNKHMRELLVLHFSKSVALLNCLFVNVASIIMSDILERALAKPQRPFPILFQELTSELSGALQLTDLRQ
jgi:hypothetical protein